MISTWLRCRSIYWGWPHPKTQIIIGKELWMALTFWANPQYTPTNNGQIQESPDTKQQRKLLKSIKNSWNKNDGVYPFANENAQKVKAIHNSLPIIIWVFGWGHPQYLVFVDAFHTPPLHNIVMYSTCWYFVVDCYMLFEMKNYVLLNKLITLITNFWLYVNAN
jgi:hypothetical protein